MTSKTHWEWDHFSISATEDSLQNMCYTSPLLLLLSTSSSAMTERPRELDQHFSWGSIWGYHRLKGYFSCHCAMTQFTLTNHMVNKPFLLLGLAAEYRSRRRRRWCDKHCGRPSDVYDTDWRTKLTVLETISRWLLLKKQKIAVSATL